MRKWAEGEMPRLGATVGYALAMKLFFFPFAPNPTKVRAYLVEKGLSIETQLVNLIEGEQRKPEHTARDPLQKLPVLELDDGSYLTESLAIVEYLEERHPEPSMFGATPEQRAHVRNRERIADLGVLINVGRYVHATNSPVGYPPNPGVAEHALVAMRGPLRVLEDGLGESEFLMGDRPTLVDCTLFAAFNFAAFREVQIDPAFAGLHAWFERYSKRDGIAELNGF